MRITVALVVNLVANGMSTEDIIREYPDLEGENIRQSLQFASALANDPLTSDALRESQIRVAKASTSGWSASASA